MVPFGLYDASVAVSLYPNLFGGIRRPIEIQDAIEAVAAEQLRAARLALAGNVATTAIQEAALSEQIVVSGDILGRYRERLGLVKVCHAVGAEPIANILPHESLIHSQEVVLVRLHANQTRTRHRLEVLLGMPPSNYAVAGFRLTELPLQRRILLSLPAGLVVQRLDIRAAAAQLHTISAAIGMASADMLPHVTLSANITASAAALAKLAASSAWASRTRLAQPLLDRRALAARRRAAIDRYAAVRAAYRAMVLAAFRSVAGTRTALESDAEILTSALQAERLARRAFDAAEVQYRSGGLTYTELLLAQTQYGSATLTRLAAQAQRLTDTVALRQVLEGRWDDHPILRLCQFSKQTYRLDDE